MNIKLQPISNTGDGTSNATNIGTSHRVGCRPPIARQPDYRAPQRYYDAEFVVTDPYRKSLPDLQNGPASLIQGSVVAIQQVGIHNFRLPLRYATPNGEALLLETSVTGAVSLEAHKKGINMSRIMRAFYDHSEEVFSLATLEHILLSYRRDLDSLDAHVTLRFSYPLRKESMRSGLLGYQYYEAAMEARMDREGQVRKFLHLDFVYSSTCPCSYELSQHAIATRGVAAVPHSQRSVARVTVELDGPITIEELRNLCLNALQTETQVIVKREDEQAFAELNAANLKFVEDAVRLLYQELDRHSSIRDFKVLASHQESLHSHDAVSVIVKGIPGGLRAEVDPAVFSTLIHR